MAAENREAWKCLEAISNHHLPRMRPEPKRVRLHRAWNQSVEHMARQEHVSLSQAERRLDKAQFGEIFDTIAIEITRDGYGAATWVMAHLICCLVSEVSSVKSGSNSGVTHRDGMSNMRVRLNRPVQQGERIGQPKLVTRPDWARTIPPPAE